MPYDDEKVDKWFKFALVVKSYSGVAAASIVFSSSFTTWDSIQALDAAALPFNFNVAVIEKMVFVTVCTPVTRLWICEFHADLFYCRVG